MLRLPGRQTTLYLIKNILSAFSYTDPLLFSFLSKSNLATGVWAISSSVFPVLFWDSFPKKLWSCAENKCQSNHYSSFRKNPRVGKEARLLQPQRQNLQSRKVDSFSTNSIKTTLKKINIVAETSFHLWKLVFTEKPNHKYVYEATGQTLKEWQTNSKMYML